MPSSLRLDRLPARHDLAQQPVVARRVVMLLQMAELMGDDIIDTITRRFNKMGIKKNDALGRAAPPLLAHLQQAAAAALPSARHTAPRSHEAGAQTLQRRAPYTSR